MAQRDKNGENASERIARKFLDGQTINECNTVSTNDSIEGIVNLLLYNSLIARYCKETKKLLINNDHQFSGSRLTKERKHALEIEANKLNITVIEEL